MKLKLFHDGNSKTVDTEAAAKTWAREALGARRLCLTATERGWRYWDADAEDDNTDIVNVVVLLRCSSTERKTRRRRP